MLYLCATSPVVTLIPMKCAHLPSGKVLSGYSSSLGEPVSFCPQMNGEAFALSASFFEMTVCLLTVCLLVTPKCSTPGGFDSRSVSACVPEAFYTINFTFFFFFLRNGRTKYCAADTHL